MLLCTILPNSRPIAEILKEFGNVVRQTWSKKPIMENFLSWKVPWKTQKKPNMAISYTDLLHGTVHHPTKFKADGLDDLER